MDETLEFTLSNRQFLYKLLWRVFSEEPNAEFLDILCGDHARQVVAVAAEELPGGAELESLFATVIERAEDTALGDLTGQYVSLFIGPRSLPAPPWASVYLGYEGIMFDESTLEVRNTYRRFGFLPEAYPKVADDHLAIELSFISALYGKALEALQAGDRAECDQLREGVRAFLADHVTVWLPQMIQRLDESRYADGFYAAAVRLTEALAEADARDGADAQDEAAAED